MCFLLQAGTLKSSLSKPSFYQKSWKVRTQRIKYAEVKETQEKRGRIVRYIATESRGILNRRWGGVSLISSLRRSTHYPSHPVSFSSSRFSFTLHLPFVFHLFVLDVKRVIFMLSYTWRIRNWNSPMSILRSRFYLEGLLRFLKWGENYIQKWINSLDVDQ